VIRASISFIAIWLVRLFARLFYRAEIRWIDPATGKPGPLMPPGKPKEGWQGITLIAILNHTSLYEPLYATVVPTAFIWQMARKAVVPVAEKTMKRPLAGLFFRLLLANTVSITRKRDHTWQAVLERIGDDALVVILPEGRMKRSTGLDLKGRPMDIRPGIADLLRVAPDGVFLIAYSGGLHHVQHPGQHLPRLFRTLRMNLERLSIAEYRRKILEEHGEEGFVEAVRADLEKRRDERCPPEEKAGGQTESVPHG
jgi:1-acyl-sn-glycerol-3-phosphate acyltransferase